MRQNARGLFSSPGASAPARDTGPRATEHDRSAPWVSTCRPVLPGAGLEQGGHSLTSLEGAGGDAHPLSPSICPSTSRTPRGVVPKPPSSVCLNEQAQSLFLWSKNRGGSDG